MIRKLTPFQHHVSIRSHHYFVPSVFLLRHSNRNKDIPKNEQSPVKHDIPKHWSEVFASTSEAIVKAEQARDESIEDLQNETVEELKKGPPTTNHNTNKI